MSEPVLELAGASFGYPGRTVVLGVDLVVRSGEVVALLGPNGAGKSTLVRGLLGLVDQHDGQVRLLGAPLPRHRERHRIGYVPQRHTLAGSIPATAGEVVMTGRLPHRRWWGRPSARDRQVVAEALEQVGLNDRARTDVAALSGGQQRRVLIARALAAEPDLLVLDEPTAGVDEASQQVLAQVLAGLAREGATMLVVTHEPAPLREVVTRVVELVDGTVHFDGDLAGYTEHRHHVLTDPHLPETEPEPALPSAGPLPRLRRLP